MLRACALCSFRGDRGPSPMRSLSSPPLHQQMRSAPMSCVRPPSFRVLPASALQQDGASELHSLECLLGHACTMVGRDSEGPRGEQSQAPLHGLARCRPLHVHALLAKSLDVVKHLDCASYASLSERGLTSHAAQCSHPALAWSAPGPMHLSPPAHARIKLSC